MLSFTTQVPWKSTASHGITIPLAGMAMTSPGTSSVDMACSVSETDTTVSEESRHSSSDVQQNVKHAFVSSANRHSHHAVRRHHIVQHHVLLQNSQQGDLLRNNNNKKRNGHMTARIPVTNIMCRDLEDKQVEQGQLRSAFARLCLTFLMVYSEVAMDMTDMKTMAVA